MKPQRKRVYLDKDNDYYYDEFYIPKKSGMRRICAPSDNLKEYQRSLLPFLQERFSAYTAETGTSDVFHGFVKNRNIVTAAEQHIGYLVTLMMDIDSFFDSVIPYNLKETANPFYQNVDGTAGQGFPTSPIISNIYIVEAINYIKKYLDKKFKGDFALTVYGDDIAVSLNTTSYYELRQLEEAITTVLTYYNLSINPRKTRIRWAKFGYRKILGISVGDDHIKPSRKLKNKLRAARHRARTVTDPSDRQYHAASAGGLTTASLLLKPRTLRKS